METIQADCFSAFQDAQEALKMVCGNDLVLSKIASYLSITDLKQLSCVNKVLLQGVRSLYRFASLFCQKVTGEMDIHVFKLSRAIVEVDKLNRDTLLQLAPEIFQEIQHLEFQGLENLPDVEKHSRLIAIVSNCQQLKSLTLATIKTLKDDNESFLRDENVKKAIANLKELHIGPPLINYDGRYDQPIENTDENPTYELFGEIIKNMKLVKFTYTEPSVLKNSWNSEFLLKKNRETLKDLNLAIDFKHLDSLKTLNFFEVSKLELNVFEWPTGHYLMQKDLKRIKKLPESLIQFLQNNFSNLMEFQFGANFCVALAPVCLLLAQPRYTENLKVLGFNSTRAIQPSLDWNFLKNISKLRDFKLDYVNKESFADNRDEITKFLSAPPSNIESIDLRGLKLCGFLEVEDSDEEFITIRRNDVNARSVSPNLLEFTNLTALKIHCQRILNDQVVQFICTRLKKLKILQGDFSDVTSDGITINRHRHGTRHSLANLKDLVELEISTRRDELLFTVDELISSVRCLDLIKLTVKLGMHHNRTLGISNGQLLRLLIRNPRLECVNLRLKLPANNIREDVSRLYPRFKWQWE